MQNGTNKKYGVVIVAGGSGKRFGTDMPKQFLLLNGKPVLMHTIERFAETKLPMKIVVVLPEAHHETWTKLCTEHAFELPHELVTGGDERFFSVKNGLEKLDECKIIGIHDGVRPLISAELIEKCYATAERNGSCVPAIAVPDSLRRGSFSKNEIVDRTNLYRLQTPQVFRKDWIIGAYRQSFDKEFTDDASVAEKAGFPIILTSGEEENIKITHQKDLSLAATFFSMKSTFK
ncbi:MAG: 2-C-methyl-D-erythritol 4-phosphate cytidylyltransferase [Salinivirgaceae bacterium]|jgi:2-C-methyl-D-erythritol 4-phosphate cytidylyltransferase|nr:2-C-methyl-D-erythritol 4-phosphate cytidylyltransferase [Salinivirgaceae bacterium]